LRRLNDCAGFVRQAFPEYEFWDTKRAEQAVIQALKPCLNVHHNPEPGGLSEQVYDRSSYREPASRWRKTSLPRCTEAEQGEMELGGL